MKIDTIKEFPLLGLWVFLGIIHSKATERWYNHLDNEQVPQLKGESDIKAVQTIADNLDHIKHFQESKEEII